MMNGDFKKSIIWGGNFGRDADTIAAIVGALSGAMHGASAIPPSWIEKARHAAGTCLPFTKGRDLKDVSRQLAELIK
jgi:ADP-ribosylglycohydrolase